MIDNEYELMKKAVVLLDNKKAIDIVALNIEELTILTRYFVVCTGGSAPQIDALSDEIQEKLAENVVKIEGKSSSGWIIIDLGGVMVHIFSRQMRDFYALEHLWEGAKKLDVKSIITEEGDNQ